MSTHHLTASQVARYQSEGFLSPLPALDADLTRSTLAARDESLGIIRKRAEGGVSSDLELNQAQGARAFEGRHGKRLLCGEGGRVAGDFLELRGEIHFFKQVKVVVRSSWAIGAEDHSVWAL